MHLVFTKFIRYLAWLVTFPLPVARRLDIQRRLRGREELRKLKLSDCTVVSFGKSGRTWLRVMLSRIYQVRHGLPARSLIGFDNLHRRNRSIPRIFFSHDNYLKDFTGNRTSKADYYEHKVILLVRHAADVAVSQYFQWRYRMRTHKKALNAYPADQADVSVYDFVMGKEAGLPKIIGFMNGWAAELPRMKDLLIVRYEDMKAAPSDVLRRILEFIGAPSADEEIQEAVNFASFENMRQMEAKRTFWFAGGRMVPKDSSNPNSYKVRRAKVGGYLDYFDPDQAQAIECLIDESLAPVFGYRRAASRIAGS